ncbi:hypothetical protein PsYK624_166060 [Phanerochaete sordida]|uniref:F-box domain-containing protein n=1 Tax=Phanerochaete sordida TaxID=48140 RepID=A0A9P3GWS0_9APHY|nr:hypothetical protein PsYK624_166060 [Phanerochaete sordida]
MSGLLDLPPELLEQILLELDPPDVAAAAQTCRAVHELIYAPENELFWRKLYLCQPFDDPRTCRTPLGDPVREVDWKHALQRIVRAHTVVNNPGACHPDERLTVVQTLLELARYTPPLSSTQGDELSLNLVWLAALLRGGSFLDAPLWVPTAEEAQARAHLHTLFGLTTHDFRKRRRVDTRAFVYDFRNYSAKNIWGPFVQDGSGRVNWEHVLALHHVMSMQIVPQEQGEQQSYTIFPMSLPFTQSIVPPDLDLDTTEDWAGVEGFWQCAFSFIDHRDLLVFNKLLDRDPSHNDEVKTALFERPDFAEVFGGLNVHLKLARTEHDPEHPTRPILHFTGESKTGTTMAGYVCVTSDDNIRWHFESGQNGDNVWSSEGVQVGNVRSPFGVLGTWTTVTHDVGDPIGPFWMRRIPANNGQGFA